jgi:FlaA1/EpsC-like NDP-sugar epimerase
VQIRFTGLRPGEKLHETLFDAAEQRLPTVNPVISATRPGPLPDHFAGSLDKLYAAAADGDDELIRALLGEMVPEYRPDHGMATASVPVGTLPSDSPAMASPYPDEF